MKKNSYTFKLNSSQQQVLTKILRQGNYRPSTVPYTSIAVKGNECIINLYTSGKCLIQGKGAEDFVTFVLEPQVLLEVRLGYEEVLNPEASKPHMGIDESGKGDFFGPLVIAAAYIDSEISEAFKELGVRDSKTIKSDKISKAMARDIRKILRGRFSVVVIGSEAYNRLYSKMNNVNAMLAWGHARAIENLLDKVPDCPRALSDQFGPTRQIENALMKKGKQIKLDQMPKAESDPAVAAASILARAGFLDALSKLEEEYDHEIPKGASARVQEAGAELVEQHGPEVLLKLAKCHFKTTDQVLAKKGHTRKALGELGRATSKAYTRNYKRK